MADQNPSEPSNGYDLTGDAVEGPVVPAVDEFPGQRLALEEAEKEMARARQRLAREQVDRERELAEETGRVRARMAKERASLQEERAALENERAALENERAALEQERTALEVQRADFEEERRSHERLLSRRGRRKAIAQIEARRAELRVEAERLAAERDRRPGTDGRPSGGDAEGTRRVDEGVPKPTADHRDGLEGEPTTPEPDDSPAWVAPVGGSCPETHEVKANEASAIYHLPGMAAYERTRPDRCYATAEAAESDGFRAAKR